MATALDPEEPFKMGIEEFETLSETALAFIKEALDLEEHNFSGPNSNLEQSALLHYEEGLRLLDRALAIQLETEDIAKKKTKMSRNRQQVIFRIHEIRSKSLDQNMGPKVEDCEMADVQIPPSDAKILFTIAGKVQIFHISSDGKVSTPSYPSSLFMFKLQSDTEITFLQVGSWVYPIVPGKSPILKSSEGSYMFPDLDENQIGNAVGLILPADILDIEKQEFEHFLEELSKDPNADLKEYEECLEYSTQVSAGLVKGAEYVGRGMVKGAIKSSEWMYIGAEKLKDKIVPENEPRHLDPKLKASLNAARWVSNNTVKASGYLVSKAGTASVALGRFLAPHLKYHSAKALSHIIEQSDEKSHKQLDIASELAGGTLTALSTVYSALESSSRILATNVANNTVQIVSHKYGNELGGATENALTAAGNTYLTAYNATALGPKALAKRAVKTTGKLTVGVSEEVILGPRTSQESEDNSNTKAIEHEKK